MIDYQERLSGLLHINDILETVQMVAGKKSELLQLLELCFVEDARMAGNALWVGMHLSSADIQCFTPYADRFIDGSMIETTVTCRRLRLAMLERLDVVIERADFFDFCLQHSLLLSEPYGIRSLCIKLAYRIAQPYPELCRELLLTLQLMHPSELSPGLRNIYEKTLSQLKNMR